MILMASAASAMDKSILSATSVIGADYGLRHCSPCTGRDIKSVVPVLLDLVGSEALARRLVPIEDSYCLEP